MEYQGYSAKIEYDEDLHVFHGQVLNINDVITFQGTSIDELRRELEASVDDYLAWCEERGEEPDRPFSGKFLLRIDPETHRRATLAAGRAGLSLTAWVGGAIERALREGVEGVEDERGSASGRFGARSASRAGG